MVGGFRRRGRAGARFWLEPDDVQSSSTWSGPISECKAFVLQAFGVCSRRRREHGGSQPPGRSACGRASWTWRLIPSVEYLRGASRGYEILPGFAIAARGPVRSVKLFSRVPLGRIDRLALDEGSRTSQALARVWLDAAHGVRPGVIEELPLGVSALESTADAVLVIGDRAMKVPDEPFHEVVDLAEAWRELTGLPFVFALWVVRGGADLGDLPAALERSRAEGLAHADELARIHGPRLGLDFRTCYDYLTRVLSYDLGEPEIAGLRRFARGRRALGLPRKEWTLSSTAPAILQRAVDGGRVTFDEGVTLFREADLLDLGRAADAVCRRLHPEPYRTYNIDRNINYTNVCTAVCDFCAFYRKVGDTEAYVLDRDVLLREDPRDRRPRRRPDPDAGRPAPDLRWSGTRICSATSRPSSRRSTSTASARRRSTFTRSCRAAAPDGPGAAEGRRAGQPPRRRRRDPRRPRPQGHHPRQGADRRLAERPSRLARAGRPVDGHA